MKRRSSRTVVITGAAGFIGFHLAQELLKQRWNVVGVDVLTNYYDPRIKQKRLEILKKYPKFRFYKVDIARYAMLEKILKVERPDEIVHLAAQAGVRYSLTNPWAYIDSNMLGMLNVFEAAKRLKLSRVLYASSSSVYGLNKKSPMSESDRTDTQISVYAATKKVNEALAHSYNHLYGFETVGLRFFTVYGVWGRPDLALFKFVKNILAGKPINVYNRGKMKRSFTHISDIVAGIVAILRQKSHGRNEIYNLGGAEVMPLLSFIKLIERETGKKAEQNLMPMQAGDVRETVVDWSKAHKRLGFVPKTTMHEGVAEFVCWFRDNEKFLRTLREPKQ
ncbi:MAG: NAD-dependent epimerase/dehydratase family protein [Candidatus Paceibacterota bacterium]